MLPYRLNEADLLIPLHWQDQSLNIFRIPASGDVHEASFIFSRDSSQGASSFSDYVAKQVTQCRAQLHNFKLLAHQVFTEPVSYAWLDYTWESEGRVLLLRQLFFERVTSNLIATLTHPLEDAAAHEPAWHAVVRSMQLSGAV